MLDLEQHIRAETQFSDYQSRLGTPTQIWSLFNPKTTNWMHTLQDLPVLTGNNYIFSANFPLNQSTDIASKRLQVAISVGPSFWLVLIIWFPIGHRWLLQKAAELWVWLRITFLAASCSLRNSCDFSDGNWSCCENEDLSKFCVDRYAARRSRPHSSWIGCGWKWMNMGGSLELVVLRGWRSTLKFEGLPYSVYRPNFRTNACWDGAG